MGIYDGQMVFPQVIPAGSGRLLVLMAAVLVLLVAGYGLLSWLSTPQPLQLEFEKNPVRANESNFLMKITVSNTTGTNASSVLVSAQPRTPNAKLVLAIEKSGRIGGMAAGESRQVNVLINPVEGILPGSYWIDVQASLNGEFFSKSIELRIEP
ncbi:MAG: hypothetical protein HY917_04800 [Candidatus Diapherotrites archaeon]|nr:hypothetical protein [Candidatus Diapherotrites archaeon]